MKFRICVGFTDDEKVSFEVISEPAYERLVKDILKAIENAVREYDITDIVKKAKEHLDSEEG